MKEKMIIYGAAKSGKAVYELLKDQYDIIGFCDQNASLIGNMINGVEVHAPDWLLNYRDVGIIIGSYSARKILQIREELDRRNITKVYTIEGTRRVVCMPLMALKALNEYRTIDLGRFLIQRGHIELKELTYMPGGSKVLDYAFIREVAIRFRLKNYLEIGSLIGESINCVADVCDVCHSLLLPPDHPNSDTTAAKEMNYPDYAERLMYSDKIQKHYGDSAKFDFSSIHEDIDLYFIDGDHSYDAVKQDTINVFRSKDENAFVIWHDFKCGEREFREEVIKAVYDAIGEDEFEGVYVTDNNLCGIFIPEKYRKLFCYKKPEYTEEKQTLYVYKTELMVSTM